jgi:hypothetical protein
MFSQAKTSSCAFAQGLPGGTPAEITSWCMQNSLTRMLHEASEGRHEMSIFDAGILS